MKIEMFQLGREICMQLLSVGTEFEFMIRTIYTIPEKHAFNLGPYFIRFSRARQQ